MRVNKLNFVSMLIWIPALTVNLMERDIFWSIFGVLVLVLNGWCAFENEDPILNIKQGGKA